MTSCQVIIGRRSNRGRLLLFLRGVSRTTTGIDRFEVAPRIIVVQTFGDSSEVSEIKHSHQRQQPRKTRLVRRICRFWVTDFGCRSCGWWSCGVVGAVGVLGFEVSGFWVLDGLEKSVVDTDTHRPFIIGVAYRFKEARPVALHYERSIRRILENAPSNIFHYVQVVSAIKLNEKRKT